MADISKTIKNGLAVGGMRPSISRNADGVYTGRQTPYFGFPQNRVASLYGQYATDYYAADMQGYDPDDFYRFWPVKIRCMDVTRETTGSNLSDDIKAMVVCEPEGVNYVPPGAHVKFARNIWLVTNPSNVAAIMSDVIIRRCNAVYRRLDYYGNVLECPFNIPKVMPRGAQDDYTKNMILADHYFTCAMQINEVSAAIHENTRMILGDAAYSVRGLDNFTQEFTGDVETANPVPTGGSVIIVNGSTEIVLDGASVSPGGAGNVTISGDGGTSGFSLPKDAAHIMYFQMQREENASVYDDMERKIADGLAFSWDISLTANVSMREGQTQTVTAQSVRNGAVVTGTGENPISYRWSTSDASVAAVSSDGTVTAVGEGTATITCTLAQNQDITETVEITVTAAAGAYVAFNGALPDTLAEQESATISASFYEDGQTTAEPVTFSLSGPDGGEYSADIDGNEITITCWERSGTPLVITAESGGYSAQHTIRLEAW